VLNHGDYRLGNLLAENGKLTPRLTGVLDWELAHFGDPHEDLAFGCMAVWRFARYDRPALGLGSLEDYFAAYEEAGGAKVDHERFRYWIIHRTVWWALGCLKMAQHWRTGQDRMLERVRGEADQGELAIAVAEWLATLKDRISGHDRFQLAVARNALGMIGREARLGPSMLTHQRAYCDKILSGDETLDRPEMLADLKTCILEKVQVDVPRYPALAVAREKWL